MKVGVQVLLQNSGDTAAARCCFRNVGKGDAQFLSIEKGAERAWPPKAKYWGS